MAENFSAEVQKVHAESRVLRLSSHLIDHYLLRVLFQTFRSQYQYSPRLLTVRDIVNFTVNIAHLETSLLEAQLNLRRRRPTATITRNFYPVVCGSKETIVL